MIKLSDHFSYKRLIKFSFPTILMMVFTSIYASIVVVEGFGAVSSMIFILANKKKYQY